MMVVYECRYYRRLDSGAVECQLCPHRCHIADGKTGICHSRRNQGGVLISEVYAQPCALAIDPVEKKPLYHFHPGTQCLSIACTGCNFRCFFPRYKMKDVSPTPLRTLQTAKRIAEDEGIKHVYLGNV